MRNTQGYYYPQNGNEEAKTNVPTGTLQIEASNLPEFKELLEQAKKRATNCGQQLADSVILI